MRWHSLLTIRSTSQTSRKFRLFSSSGIGRELHRVPTTNDWNLETFRKLAFIPALPLKLGFVPSVLPPACQKWFTHNDCSERQNGNSVQSVLQLDFWSRYASIAVPLEVTVVDPTNNKTTFTRSDFPLQYFLDYLTQPSNTRLSVYLAQCQLSSLPKVFRDDLPTPEIVLKAGKGDIYDTNLWVGRSPTYTPLHRDPNPNLFVQLAGSKVVRLFPPEVGRTIFEDVQEKIGGRGSSVFRGEEMMQGKEKELLERAVWGADGDGSMADLAMEAELDWGEALFIPKGWWHSIKGVGQGITASVNWWFR